MATSLDLITEALEEIGAISAGETVSAADSAKGLRTFNRMVEAFSADRLNIFEIARDVYTLIPGQQEYTIGAADAEAIPPIAPDFEAARPIRIERAGAIAAGQTRETRVDILDSDEWAAVEDKGRTSDYPDALYYSPAVPLGSLFVLGVPATASRLVLYPWRQLAGAAELTTELVYPPGYHEAMLYGLARRLCRPFGRSVTTDLELDANRSLAAIQSLNAPCPLMACDSAVLRGHHLDFDWKTGE